MTDKLRELLEDVQTVYEGKGMVVHPNSFDRLRTEIIKLDNINKQQSEQIEKLEEENTELKEQNIKDCENFNKKMKEIKEQWNKEHYQLTKALKEENEKLQLLIDMQNFLIEPKNKEKKEHLKQSGWVEITMPCSKEDARECLTKQEGLCESTDGLCRIKINLSRLCRC